MNDPEIRPTLNSFAAVVVADRIDVLLGSVSQVHRLVRSTAYLLRWFHNAKRAPKDRLRDEFRIEELKTARRCLLRHEQLAAFKGEWECLRIGRPLLKDSKIASLRPFIDDTTNMALYVLAVVSTGPSFLEMFANRFCCRVKAA